MVPLVLGAGGMLGTAVARLLERRYPATVSATRAEADVTDRFRLAAEVERLQPTVVINCAAYTDVDGCEVDADRARRVNIEGAENVARAAAGSGCRLVHVSTDFVFDGGSRRPYREDDPTGPLSVYGRSKLEGEQRAAEAAADHLIVRSSWLFGRGRANFVDAIRARAASGPVLKVVSDQVGSPTFVEDLAEALLRLLRVERRGVVHFANAGSCSRLDLARAIIEALGTAATARPQPITTEEAGRLAARPAYSALDTSLYTLLTGTAPRPWKDALRAYLAAGDDPGAGA